MRPSDLGLEVERVRPPKLAYSRHAVSPLPYALGALVSIAALVGADRWATSGSFEAGFDARGTLSEAWFTIDNLLLAQLDEVSLLRSSVKAWVLLGLAAVVVVAVALWVARLGRNLPLGQPSFGVGLALLALPAWWTVPLTAGLFDDPGTSRIDALMRLGVAASLLVVQYLLLRRLLLLKVWRAGRLPGELASALLWVPELIPWSMLLGSSIYTLAATETGRPAPDTWRPTDAMIDWGSALSIISAAAIVVLLLVASVRQQQGIAEDRERDEAAREADRRNRTLLEAAAP